MKRKSYRKRTTTIVVRGCLIRVAVEDVAKFSSVERELTRKDWNANRVD
jgi:hypothetical protein